MLQKYCMTVMMTYDMTDDMPCFSALCSSWLYDRVCPLCVQGSVQHCMIGVQLLSQLTVEMNTLTDTDAIRSLNRHRKTAASFRDTSLYEVFQLSCTLLRTALENCKNLDFSDEAQVGSVAVSNAGVNMSSLPLSPTLSNSLFFSLLSTLFPQCILLEDDWHTSSRPPR